MLQNMKFERKTFLRKSHKKTIKVEDESNRSGLSCSKITIPNGIIFFFKLTNTL